MAFDKCPGCGHNYNYPMSSRPNEHGYCHWCREEGVYDAASHERSKAYWEAYHRRQEQIREEEYQRLRDEGYYG